VIAALIRWSILNRFFGAAGHRDGRLGRNGRCSKPVGLPDLSDVRVIICATDWPRIMENRSPTR
jgi:hypothetical protein